MRRILASIIALISLAAPTHADNKGLNTLVIDAGHGGHDPGAVSRDRATQEKNLTLDIAKKFAQKVRESYPDVKVVLTRDSDKFVALSDRAEIANKSGANLFVSIHINASRNTKANGYSIHVLGQSSKPDRDLFAYNMDVVQRENAVMMLEDDYTTKYADFDPEDTRSFIFLQLMQSANLEQSLDFAQTVINNLGDGPIMIDRGIWQDPFYVLWKTSMPAVLVELGFISNSEELATLRQESNRDRLADALYRSFSQYKTKYDASLNINRETAANEPAAATPAAKPEKTTEAPAAKAENIAAEGSREEVMYGIQIFAVSRTIRNGDSALKGYEPLRIGNSLIRYIVCTDRNKEAVIKKLPEVQNKFKDAFIVKIVGDNVTLEK